MSTQINETVAKTMSEQLNKVQSLIVDREAEIARLDASAPTKVTRSKGYEAVDPTSPEAVTIAESATNGMYSKTGIDFQVGKGVIRKVAASVKGEKVVSTLGQIEKDIKAAFASMQQAALAQQPNKKVRGTGTGGSHAITKAWFEKNASKCPEAMDVSWNDATNKIEYNLPKGGRGATVSHGALNNILKAYESATLREPVVPKTIPEKKSKKAGKK